MDKIILETNVFAFVIPAKAGIQEKNMYAQSAFIIILLGYYGQAIV